MKIKEALKTEAVRLGFSLFGVTAPEPPRSLQVYLRWLQAGRHGEMAYLSSERAVERRSDPAHILPGVRSIILLGIRYPRPQDVSPPPEDGLYGRVAAYAWGVDYHDLLIPRLKQLSLFIQQQTSEPVNCRYYTDTGPVLERDLASRAGLGWAGKNTNLINPQGGSYYLLAEMLTTAEIEPDQPFLADQCGSCSRCIEACPTGCILPDRTIDARACISYLTIENKGAIPVQYRSQMGDWVFGCDVCQQVCPWNIRFAGKQYDAGLQPVVETARPELIGALALTPSEFNHRFKTSPIRRARRRGFLRNVAVALGNTHNPDAAPFLAQVLTDEPESMVRAHAAWALGQIKTHVARAALARAVKLEKEPAVLEEISASLEG